MNSELPFDSIKQFSINLLGKVGWLGCPSEAHIFGPLTSSWWHYLER